MHKQTTTLHNQILNIRNSIRKNSQLYCASLQHCDKIYDSTQTV